jgi:hypothetical protein
MHKEENHKSQDKSDAQHKNTMTKSTLTCVVEKHDEKKK